jgi:predicted enzyme related to lactoylglutathione lyase
MANPVVHFEFISAEAPKLQKFFADVFAWKIDTSNPFGYGMVDTGEKAYGIQGGIGAPGPFGKGHVAIYVEVDDVDATLKKVEASGGKVLMPKMAMPNNGPVLAQFTDPTGNVVGLSERHKT